MKNDNRIIISFSDEKCELLAIRRQPGRRDILLSGQYDLGNGQLPLPVIERLQRSYMNRDAKIILVIPRRQTIFKYFTLASSDPDEMRRMLTLKLDEDLPFPKEEMVFDISAVETNAEGYTKVIVCLTQYSTIEKYLSYAQRSNLHPDQCAINVFGTVAWLNVNHVPEPDQVILLLSSVDNTMDLTFYGNKKLLFSRTISCADIQNEDNELNRQIDLTFETFAKEYPGKKVSRFIAAQPVMNAYFWQKYFSDHFNLVPIESIVTEKTYLDENTGSLLTPETSGAIPAALWGLATGDNPGPNLIPRSMADAKQKNDQKTALTRFFVAVCLVFILTMFATWARLHGRMGYLKNIQETIQSNEPAAEKARRQMDFFRSMQNDISNNVLIADLVREMFRIVPDNAALSSFQLSNGSVILSGRAKVNSDVNAVQSGMTDSILFKDVVLQYANQNQNYGDPFIEFRMIGRVNAVEEGEL